LAAVFPGTGGALVRKAPGAGRETGTGVTGIETEEGVHIGNIGLHRIDWKNRHTELGIAIGEKAYWDQGYGGDAIRTMLKLAFREMNMHRVQLRVDADNARAIRCYEKAGFKKEGTLREIVFREGKYVGQHVMSILQQEFESNG
jgi:RimJ/RimL family protein N-acetyltransferase